MVISVRMSAITINNGLCNKYYFIVLLTFLMSSFYLNPFFCKLFSIKIKSFLLGIIPTTTVLMKRVIINDITSAALDFARLVIAFVHLVITML